MQQKINKLLNRKSNAKEDTDTVNEDSTVGDESTNAPSLTLEEVNDGYMKGSLLPVDAQIALLGCEGAGKTCLIDTFLGKDFHDTPPTEGADQMEISIKTTVNWHLLSDDEKLRELEKQALLETEYFLLKDEPEQCLPSITAEVTATASIPVNSSASKQKRVTLPVEKTSLDDHHSPSDKHMKFVSIEEFHQLKAMKEEYDPHKRYVHLRDFAGQQVTGYICMYSYTYVSSITKNLN